MTEIRPAEAHDLTTIRGIYEHAVLNGTGTFELVPPSQQEMRERFEKINSRGYPWLVAVQDGQIAGYAYGGPFRERPAYRWSVEDSIYLHPDFQGRGIGKLLLTSLIEACANLGFRQMFAIIGDSQNAGSVNLHKSLGFEMVGIMKDSGQKHGRWLDTVIMNLALGEGSSTQPDFDTYPGTMFKA